LIHAVYPPLINPPICQLDHSITSIHQIKSDHSHTPQLCMNHSWTQHAIAKTMSPAQSPLLNELFTYVFLQTHFFSRQSCFCICGSCQHCNVTISQNI
jgi:hypothetical protein